MRSGNGRLARLVSFATDAVLGSGSAAVPQLEVGQPAGSGQAGAIHDAASAARRASSSRRAVPASPRSPSRPRHDVADTPTPSENLGYSSID